MSCKKGEGGGQVSVLMLAVLHEHVRVVFTSVRAGTHYPQVT